MRPGGNLSTKKEKKRPGKSGAETSSLGRGNFGEKGYHIPPPDFTQTLCRGQENLGVVKGRGKTPRWARSLQS